MTANNSTATSVSSSLVLLFRLIEANDWEKLKIIFLAPEKAKTFQHLSALVAKSTSFNGMTILHACVRFNPPSGIINRMIELCPDAPRSQDCLNRTPLHVAAGTSACPSVLKVLVDSYPDACEFKDKDGRMPLHMACDSSCELFEDSKGQTQRSAPSYKSIAVLLAGSLNSAVEEDNDGTSPIEYALCSNADMKTVRLIQKVAQKVMKKKHDEKNNSKFQVDAQSSRQSLASSAGGRSRRVLSARSA
mmetsp:Transcript_40649/g.85387  ORF Transcript_40649/g.85387 Transcript_40649/m.85387 type:complete len:247 (-) Transcript_40649:76-816(-)|eukprot:CAMPEP_0183702740 /NCGR_PEP_ID=MMETSP0737-20130205/750_1 /TAXON_ID=385413 /ORGANISM="Thalassiosira miniscula, Strain CCMP1093" /LENGTH=246 /DNA_ID=CAMNT_0025929407 /DNA_START=302 /DNA_END=1042 /DNA_ORIENTATION=-